MHGRPVGKRPALPGLRPTLAELRSDKAKLRSLRGVPQVVRDVLAALPASSHPMDVLRTAVSALGCALPEKDDHGTAGARDIADGLIASLGSMLCYWYHASHNGNLIDVETDDDSIGGHFLHLLHGRKAPEDWIRAMHTSLNLYAEHEFNASTFPARVVCHDILGQTALVDLAGLRDAIAAQGGDPALVNPVVPTQLVVDHSLAVEHGGYVEDAFAKNRAIEERRNTDRFHFIEWTKFAFRNVDVIPPGNGILHQINIERMSPVVQVTDGVAYPDTLVGTDSHTPMVDALGVVGIGVGGLEAESVMLGRAVWMRLPEIVGVTLTGQAGPGITATDIVLGLTEFLRQAKVVSAYLEFHGDGARGLTLGDRATISNMAPEFGATAALFSIDEKTLTYLRLTGRDAAQVALVETYARAAGLWSDSLLDARYDRVLQFDLGSVVRTIAGPASPHQRIPTSTLTARGLARAVTTEPGQMPDGAIIIAAITSCTNTSNPRNMVAAGLLARNANARGLVRKPWVNTSLAPGSKTVQLYLEEAGLLPELKKLGFDVVAFACTSCNGMSGALEPAIEEEILARKLYTTAVLSGNRNFEGRIHPRAREAYLASPPFYRKVYEPMFAFAVDHGAKVSPLYDWRPQSTYIRRPPYWEGALAGRRTLTGMRPLALLGDNITTDHLSPSNAILPDSAAGEYLARMGLPQEDFNSYATHRGDHLTAQRATFANPRLKNEMVRASDGSVREGSFARVEPDGEVRVRRVTGRPRACASRASRLSLPRALNGFIAPTSLAWASCRWSFDPARPD